MTDKTEQLNDLIEITRDGQEFYQSAAEHVDNPRIRTLFQDMAQAKSALVRDLSAEVRVSGDRPARHGTFSGSMHQAYGNVKARLSSDGETAYIDELEEAEDRLLAAFDEAIKDADSPQLRQILQAHLPRVRQCHDVMRDIKQARH